MDRKKEYSKYVGFGLIIGVAIGSSVDVITGGFSGIPAAIGAGLGIVVGSMIGHYTITKKASDS